MKHFSRIFWVPFFYHKIIMFMCSAILLIHSNTLFFDFNFLFICRIVYVCVVCFGRINVQIDLNSIFHSIFVAVDFLSNVFFCLFCPTYCTLNLILELNVTFQVFIYDQDLPPYMYAITFQ